MPEVTFRRGLMSKDRIQDIVIKRAAQLNLSSYAIAQMTGGEVSEDHVRAYLTHHKSMGSHKLQHVLRALKLKIEPEK